jgi:serine/threonine protein phosphatase PrpC
MTDHRETLKTGRLFQGELEALMADHRLGSGQVAIRSLKAPDKDTPNEDGAAVIPVNNSAVVLAVADGVGGMRRGRDAAAITLRTLTRLIHETAPDGDRLRTVIMDAVEAANREILALGVGAATTLAVAEISGGHVRSYHVGDSEIFSVGQRGKIKLSVTPHSPTGFAIEAGLMDEDEALLHDERHMLSNVVGTDDMRIEVGTAVRLAQRDTVLLASDGLVDNLRVDEIVQIIRKGPLEVAADELVRRAAGRMSEVSADHPSKPDDLTVVLFRQ